MVASFLRAAAPVWETFRNLRVTQIDSAVEGGRRCCLFQTHPGTTISCPFRIALIASVSALVLACGQVRAQQYTPEHPEVRGAIEKGIASLKEGIQSDSRPGAKALAGMAIYKVTGNADDPTVLECIKATSEAYRELASKDGYPDEGMYNAGLCTLFLITVDPVRYRREIDGWLQFLARHQKPHGGWGYWGRDTGDTSMTQYGVLACWQAHQAKIPVSPAMANGALSWLLRTQDPSGAFGYQGKLAPSLTQPVPQIEIRETMATAGLGSLYVMADLFGANGRKKDGNDGLPPALKPIGDDKQDVDEGGHMKGTVARDLIQRAEERGDAWFAANYKIEVRQWQYYYLYALERYKTFKELADHTDDLSPQWYNDGVNFLLKRQTADGYWSGDGGNVVDTSFAILFLKRATKQMVKDADFGAGIMLGGRGIPKNTDQITVRDGQVVSLEEIRLTKRMIDAVGNPESIENAEMLDAISKLPPKESRLLATEHAEKLRKLLKSDSPQAKVTVAKTLGNSGDLSNVPTLVLLLAEENKDVVLEARDALRRLSRRFDGFGLPDEYDEIERDKAIKAWKAWYRRVEPDVEFE